MWRFWRARAAVVAAALFVAAAAAIVGVMVPEQALAATTVQVGQQNGGTAVALQFNAATIVVNAGDTVHWTLFSGTHTVTAYQETTPGTPDWTSGMLAGTFDHTFTTPGVYTYYCQLHATRAAADPANVDARIAGGFMVGKIVVQAAPSVGGVAHLPSPDRGGAAAAAAGSGSVFPWWPAGVALVGTGMLLGGALIVVRRRRLRA